MPNRLATTLVRTQRSYPFARTPKFRSIFDLLNSHPHANVDHKEIFRPFTSFLQLYTLSPALDLNQSISLTLRKSWIPTSYRNLRSTHSIIGSDGVLLTCSPAWGALTIHQKMRSQLHQSRWRIEPGGLKRSFTDSQDSERPRKAVLSETSERQAEKENLESAKMTAPLIGNKHITDRLPQIPHIHKPTKEELLAAATGFWSRLKVRFKWFSIRSVRPFNIDEIGAFFSWFLLGHVLWIILGTTTFFSLAIFAVNTVFAQGMRRSSFVCAQLLTD